MRISHKVDYGVRLMTTIAELDRDEPGRPVPRHELAARDDLPAGFLVDILGQLRRLAGCAATEVATADGRSPGPPTRSPLPMSSARSTGHSLRCAGCGPHELAQQGGREPFTSMWIAVRAVLRSVLEHITIADLAAGRLPTRIANVAADPDSWDPHEHP